MDIGNAYVVTRSWRAETRGGRRVFKSKNSQVQNIIHVNVKNSMGITINNSPTLLKVFKRVDLKRLRHKKRTATTYVDRWKLDLLWWLFHNIHKYQSIMLYMWNSFNIISQEYLNKKRHFWWTYHSNYSLNIHSEDIITLLLGSSFASKISTASSIAIHWKDVFSL